VEGVESGHHGGELPRRILTLGSALLLAVLLNIGAATSAFADAYADNGSTGVSTDPNGVSVNAESSGTAVGGSTGGSGVHCTYTQIDPADAALLGPGGPPPGDWVIEQCSGPGWVNPMKVIWVPAVLEVNVGSGPTSPPALAQQAVSYLRFPMTKVEMSPPSADVTVNLPTWLWVDRGMWHAISATAAAGPVSATATATPDEVVWQMGDGGKVACKGPGTAWTSQYPPDQRSDCSYTYVRSSADPPGGTYALTTTVYWHVTWTSQGAPGGGDLGLIAGPSVQSAVQVQELHAINRGPSG
jgi:hypothetical protein